MKIEFLNQKDREMLESLFEVRQKPLMGILKNFLKKNYKKVISTKNYIYAIGDIPVALVAHCDTVFPTPPIDIFYDSEKGVMWSPDGLGADDRAGIWAIIKIIKSTKLRPHIIFTADEEMGGIGASALVKNCPKPFADMKYIIQLDRRGVNDCVFYDCFNEDFVDYVEKFGFKENFGSFSDISVICPNWKVAGVNLSIGYENEHSVSEVLWISHMDRTIKRVVKMLEEIKDAPYFNFVLNPYYYNWQALYTNNNTSTHVKCVCGKCQNLFEESDVYPAKMSDGTSKYVCTGCLSDFYWCQRCNEPYEATPEADNMLCDDCIKTIFYGGN